jgi:membrane protease YdiL (CAAX protease family)
LLVLVLAVAGALGFALAWVLVASGRASVWVAMGSAATGAGLAALATGRVRLSPGVAWPAAAGSGVGAGLLLYGATVEFVRLARRWPPFDRHLREVYGRRALVSLPAALLAAGLTAVGEELFWRGLVQGGAREALGALGGTAATWAGYVAANAPPRSLPVLAGAVVGGAAWGALALWTGGVLASSLCHATWTALMVASPPSGGGGR